jgi:hypothetical protein
MIIKRYGLLLMDDTGIKERKDIFVQFENKLWIII